MCTNCNSTSCDFVAAFLIHSAHAFYYLHEDINNKQLIIHDQIKVSKYASHSTTNTLLVFPSRADTEQWLDVLKVTSLTPGEARISTTSLSVCPTGDGDRPKRKKPLTVSLSSPG